MIPYKKDTQWCHFRLILGTTVRLYAVLLVTILISGCFIRFTPYDPPWYPLSMEYVTAIEGYQSRIGDFGYDMWSRELEDRFAAQHLELVDHYLFIAQCGLTIFDVAIPEEIKVVGKYDDVCGVDDLVVASGRAYLFARDKGLAVLDVSNVTQPSLVATHPLIIAGAAPVPTLAVIGNCIYLYTPTAKLPPKDPSRPKAERQTYTGWNIEEPAWQVLQIQDSDNSIHLQAIGSFNGIGRPRAVSGKYVYSASDWVIKGDLFNSKLQTIEAMDDCMIKIVDSQLVSAKIRGIDVNGSTLFVSVGGIIWTWDVTNPARPSRIDAQYGGSGRVGDFSVIDVDGSKVVGNGYSLTYERSRDSVRFYLLAKMREQMGECSVWNKPDGLCKLNASETYRGIFSSNDKILFGRYVFYPYHIVAETSGHELVDFAIVIYKLPD